jgi:formylglycine-generating enzyme required for sulfatase activity
MGGILPVAGGVNSRRRRPAKATAVGALAMGRSQDDKKQIRTGSRFDLDRPLSGNSWPDRRFQERSSSAAPGRQGIGAQSTDEYYHQRHEPAPMQKRARIVKHTREPRQPGGWRSTVVIVALMGLASFGIVFDLASDGKIRHFIQSNLMPPPSAKAGKELSAPETPNVTDLTISPELPSEVEAVAQPEVEAVAQPEVQLPNPPQDPPQVTVDAAKPAEPVPSPLPETAPVTETPADTAEQDAPSTPVVAPQQQGDVIRDCADCPELVVVSAGNLTKVDEAGPAAASIDHDFAIGRNDITFDDWDRCVDGGACKAIADDSGWGRGSRPLIFVSFDDVTTQYLPWLSRLSGKEYRLPTKDEWQYAALGGAGAAETKSQIGDASQDCFNASGAAAGNCPDTYNGTAPVGSFPPNALGLNDMKGNVWEWSVDCWRPFTYAPNASANTCDERVVLGGAWSTGRGEVNGQAAAWEKSSRKTNSIGFRVVRSLP